MVGYISCSPKKQMPDRSGGAVPRLWQGATAPCICCVADCLHTHVMAAVEDTFVRSLTLPAASVMKWHDYIS